MDYWLIRFVLTGALVYVISARTRLYTFVSTPLNWREAQSVCRQNYTDLATAETTADISAIIGTTSTYTGGAWIGLHDDLVNSWGWSLSDHSFYAEAGTDFRDWKVGEPNNSGGSELCVEISDASFFWNDVPCNFQLHFVCYNGTINYTPSFVKVDILSNWIEAQRFCRENYVDLASIRNQTENDIIKSLTDVSVWISLHREKQWSDGSTSLFRHWAAWQPSFDGERCVSTAFNDLGRWSQKDCSLSLPFICYTSTPPNTDSFKSIGQNETSITLQWNQVNTNVSFVLKFNGTERNISEPLGDGPVTHTVSSLTAGTKYTFTLFFVFESVRSSGVNTAAVTDLTTCPTTKGPLYVVGLKIRLKSFILLSDLNIQDLLTEFLKQQGLPPQFSLKIRP
ncbi:C-type mannose receptor 2-like [Gasterosteus aculeatus]